jgi:hypothetical protein
LAARGAGPGTERVTWSPFSSAFGAMPSDRVAAAERLVQRQHVRRRVALDRRNVRDE